MLMLMPMQMLLLMLMLMQMRMLMQMLMQLMPMQTRLKPSSATPFKSLDLFSFPWGGYPQSFQTDAHADTM